MVEDLCVGVDIDPNDGPWIDVCAGKIKSYM